MERFCDRLMLLQNGRVRSIGTPEDVIAEYVGAVDATGVPLAG
jgi:ABC-type polysaccharide/polyol phosphate transport system ATPase subunit